MDSSLLQMKTERKPKFIREKKYLYHVTEKEWPKEITLSPKHVLLADEDEPKIKRICVSEELSGCFSSINFYDSHSNVYRTKRPVTHYQPFGVSDAKITKEKWLLRKTAFVKVLNVNRNTMTEMPCYAVRGGRGPDLVKQKKEKKIIQKIIKKEFGHLGFK